MDILILLPDVIHESWEKFFDDSIKTELISIEKSIGKKFNPNNKKNVLRFLSIDIKKIKVVWLGQDVYPAKNVATGRSFEVGGLEKWDSSFRQVSLKNIIRLIYRTYYGELIKYNDIKKKIQSNEFPLIEYSKWFDSLEKQGVLFLNTSYTCEVGISNSHKKYWANFSQKVLNYISQNNEDINWFLWGNEAKKNIEYIKKGNLYCSRHPMMCSEKYKDDFLKANCFKETKNEINWLGEENEN